MSTNFYGRLFASRAVLCFFMCILLLLSCILRVAVIATGNYEEVQSQQTSYRINVARIRGTIYDCNMVPITNSKVKKVAAVAPVPQGITAISTELEGEALDTALESLRNDKIAVCEVKNDISCEGVVTTNVYERYGDTLSACHIIGYTDDTGHGVSGLERAYDDLLYSDKNVSAVFTAGGNGEMLKGIEIDFENDISAVQNGVVTTFDINIQSIAEHAAAKMNSGCVIVCEATTGKIRAMASVPTFDINNLSDSLTQSDSPMLNRATSVFNVGSVFKPCVASAAIEKGLYNHIFTCEGSTKIIDRTFRCHKLDGHGLTDMCTALSQSCNCYFYDLAISLGGDSVYKAATTLSLGNKIQIAKNLYTSSGNLPKKETLENEGALANLSIGQGSLLASPVAMLNLYNAIASDGCYYIPSVVEKTLKDGVQDFYDFGEKTRVMSEDTAEMLREYLKTVITEGTGIEAAPILTTAAGKTATAQTGRYYDDGTEITNSWFCGFFPADVPQYVVIVMSDSRLNVSTASIFAQIADGICEYKGINVKNND